MPHLGVPDEGMGWASVAREQNQVRENPTTTPPHAQPQHRRMHTSSSAPASSVAGSGASLAGAVRHAPCNPISPADRPSARGRAGSRTTCARSSSSTHDQRRSHAGLGGLLLDINDAAVNAGAPALPAPPVSPPKRARAATQARHTSPHLASHCAGDGGFGQQPGRRSGGCAKRQFKPGAPAPSWPDLPCSALPCAA